MKQNRILTAILLVMLVLAVAACASAAEIRPVPLDHDTLDLGNGVFGFFVRGGDRAEKTGFFTAVLYKKDQYDGEQIRNLAPGDTYSVSAPLFMAGDPGLGTLIEVCSTLPSGCVAEVRLPQES